jgi:hypothetical protein
MSSSVRTIGYWVLLIMLIAAGSLIVGGIGAILICIFFYD